MMKSLNQSMQTVILAAVLLLGVINQAGATATYNAASNTIILLDGTNTLQSIYTDINDPMVLSYDSDTNTYTLNAKIENVNDLAAKPSLTISDTRLLVNNTVDDEYYINGGWILTITNSTIESKNGARFRIWAPSIWGSQCKYGACERQDFYATIDNSVIIGGWIYFRIDTTAFPDPPYIRITNTVIKDVDITGAQIPFETTYGGTNNNTSVLMLYGDMGYKALLENITLENVHGGAIYGGTMSIGGSDIVLKNIKIINSSHPYWGAIHSFPAAPNATFENITISDRTGSGDGISYKEGPFDTFNYFKNIIIENFTGTGFHTYANMHPAGTGGAKIENLTIDGGTNKAAFLFKHDYAQVVNVWVFNAQLRNAQTGFRTRNNKYFFTNAKVDNITKMYDSVFGVENGEVNWYELADIYVVDSNGNPVNDVNIQIIPDTVAQVPNVVDKWFNAKTNIATGSNGHTPLPSDETGTVALLRKRDYDSGHNSVTYLYTITAEKDGKTASLIGLDIDESWYRENPEQPTKTVVLNIDTGAGYVETNYIIDLNNDGAVNILDIVIVAQHFGETTASPYPSYDINSDGSINILDIRFVAEGM